MAYKYREDSDQPALTVWPESSLLMHTKLICRWKLKPIYRTLTPLYSCACRPQGYKTHLSMKLILLTNVKMPTIVGILTLISRIHTSSVNLKQEMSLFFFAFKFLWAVESSCSVELSIKNSLTTSGQVIKVTFTHMYQNLMNLINGNFQLMMLYACRGALPCTYSL